MSSRVAKVRTNLIFCCENAGGADAEKKNHIWPQGSHVQLCRLCTAKLLGVATFTHPSGNGSPEQCDAQ